MNCNFQKIKSLKLKAVTDKNLKELLSGSAITFVFKILGMLTGYAVVLLITKKYGSEGVGLYNVIFRVVSSFALVSALGFNISVLRYVGQFSNKPDKRLYYEKILRICYARSGPFAVVLAIFLFLFSEYIALSVFDNKAYSKALQIIAVSLPLFTLNLINVEFIRGLKLLKISEYLRSINSSCIVLFILIFATFDYGKLNAVYALGFAVTITFIVSVVFIVFSLKKLPKSNGKVLFSQKEFIKTSLPMMTITIASFLLAFSGVFFLEIFTTTDKVGIYSICIMLSQLVSLSLTVVNTISAPKISELFWSDKKDDLKKILEQSSKLIFWTSFIIAVGLILMSTWILNFFGEEFILGQTVLVILVFGQLVNAVTGSVGVFLNMTGHQKILRNIIFITTFSVLVGYYLITPHYGLIGTALVSVLGTTVVNICAALYAYKKLHYVTFYCPLPIKK